MPTPALKPGNRAYLDDDSRAMIYQGCSVNQLGEIFGIKPSDVLKKLAGIRSVGTGRQGNPLYRIRDAAPRLVRIDITAEMIHQYMISANPKDLPPMTNKMFWSGMIDQRKYEEQMGELWHTEEVSQTAGAVFQSLKTSLQLIPDEIMKRAGLTERQLRIAQGILDSALENAREQLVSELQKPSREPRPGFDTEEGPL